MKVSLPLAEPEVVCTESSHFTASLVEVDHMDNGFISPTSKSFLTVYITHTCGFVFKPLSLGSFIILKNV